MVKNYLKKSIALAIITMSMMALNPIGASAEWRQNSKGWWYIEGNSWATGWKLINGNWYYFYSDGYMAHDTTIDGYYLNSSGVCSTNSYKNQIANQELIKMNNETAFNSSDFIISNINLGTINNRYFTSILGEPSNSKVTEGPPCDITDYFYPNVNVSFADGTFLHEIQICDEKLKGPRNTGVGQDVYEVISKFKCDSNAVENNIRYLYNNGGNSHSQFSGWITYEDGKIKTVQYYTEYWNWHIVYDVKDDKVTKITMFRMLD